MKTYGNEIFQLAVQFVVECVFQKEFLWFKLDVFVEALFQNLSCVHRGVKAISVKSHTWRLFCVYPFPPYITLLWLHSCHGKLNDFVLS